ncbi:hypothetical protein ACFLYL_00225 [Chloroflexota bacterium]
MESKAPPIPTLTKPAMAAITDKKVLFIWQPVDDDSKPVTYNFQIASDTAFTQNSIKVDKKNLGNPTYDLTDVEWESLMPVKDSSITQVNYFWRVQSIDGASNESTWSSVVTLGVARPPAEPETKPEPDGKATDKTGFPAWAIWVIGILVALMCGVLGYWVGRRTAYY